MEIELAHVVKHAIDAAYRRGDLLDKRRVLMEDWESFACESTGQVVALNRA